MVTDRVYRKGRSKKEACDELKRCAGTQLLILISWMPFFRYITRKWLRKLTQTVAGNRALMSLRRLEPDISPEGIYKKASLNDEGGFFIDPLGRNIRLQTAKTH